MEIIKSQQSLSEVKEQTSHPFVPISGAKNNNSSQLNCHVIRGLNISSSPDDDRTGLWFVVRRPFFRQRAQLTRILYLIQSCSCPSIPGDPIPPQIAISSGKLLNSNPVTKVSGQRSIEGLHYMILGQINRSLIRAGV